MIREAQVPLGSAVYSLRAWAYARAVAPTLKNEFRGRTGCLSHIPRRGRAPRRGGRAKTPAPHGRAQHSARPHGVAFRFWSRGRGPELARHTAFLVNWS